MASDARRRPPIRLAIVADDLTGAADAAAPFAAAGIPTVVSFGGNGGADVVAVSTESRDLPPAAARAAVAAAVAHLRAGGEPARWYKKVDSLLRGNPAAESATLARLLGAGRVVLAPALPCHGRATRDGAVVVVGGSEPAVPSAPDDAGGDEPGDLAVSAVARIGLVTVRTGSGALAAAIRSLPPGLAMADAETEDDLATIAAAALALDGVLMGGSAGLSPHLARLIPGGRAAPPVLPPRRRATLVLAGSRHPGGAAQVHAIETAGAACVVRAPTDEAVTPELTARLAAEVAAALRAGRSAVLTTVGGPPSRLPGRDLAGSLAAVAGHPAVLPLVGALVLTGGDVAAATCAALGFDGLRLGGEMERGIPWGIAEGGRAPGLPVVTKAGSFGDAGALRRCLGFLGGDRDGADR